VCGLYDELYDVDVRDAVVGQVTYLNVLVSETIEQMIEAATRPAAIIVFSDHGYRADLNDRDEMLRNLLLARTPGRSRVFPEDASPVNIVPRLLNAYVDAGLPLQRKDAFVTDLAGIQAKGYFPLVPWPYS
jgi:hypothetical protein